MKTTVKANEMKAVKAVEYADLKLIMFDENLAHEVERAEKEVNQLILSYNVLSEQLRTKAYQYVYNKLQAISEIIKSHMTAFEVLKFEFTFDNYVVTERHTEEVSEDAEVETLSLIAEQLNFMRKTRAYNASIVELFEDEVLNKFSVNRLQTA